MQLGLALPQYGSWGDPAHVAAFARGAEDLGYGSLWVGDRLLTPTAPRDLYPSEPKPYPPQFTHATDPFVVWAAAAAVTSRIRLGSSTLNAPWYHPVVLARALTSIDALSGGRLDVGFGTSWMRDEYAAVGVDWRTRGARLEETLDLLQAWWSDNPVEFCGKFVQLPESVVDLRPRQLGGPPIYLAGRSSAAMERVGRRAHGYLALAGLSDQMQTQLWDTARRAAESAGRDPDALKRVIRVNVYDPTIAALEAEVRIYDRAGYDGAFLDLTYCARNVDHALEIADGFMSTVCDRSSR